jgi:hypothetical protein
MPTAKENLLPTKIRIVAVATLATGLIVSWQSAQEIGLTLASSSLSQPSFDLSHWPLSPDDAKRMKQALEASWFAQLHTIDGMRGFRLPILIGLSTCASLVFVSALRIRWPFGAKRRRAIDMLERASIGVLLFRSLDAAQSVVIAQNGARAMLKWMPSPIEGLPIVVAAASIAQAIFISVLFFFFSRYLSSPAVRQQVEALDSGTVNDD